MKVRRPLTLRDLLTTIMPRTEWALNNKDAALITKDLSDICPWLFTKAQPDVLPTTDSRRSGYANKTCRAIFAAADNESGHDPVLRAKLVKAAGLKETNFMNVAARTLYNDLLNYRLTEFNMNTWGSCGSPRCIGGWAGSRMVAGRDIFDPATITDYNNSEKVAEYLGLQYLPKEKTPADAYDLFFPESATRHKIWGHMPHRDPYTATQPEAAEALRRACALAAGRSEEL